MIMCFLFILNLSVFGQKTTLDLKHSSLFGNIKSVSKYRYDAVDSIGYLTKEAGGRYDEIAYFNKKGFLTEVKEWKHNGELHVKGTVIHNSKGKIIKSYWYDQNDSLAMNLAYKYENGNLISGIQEKFNPNGSSEKQEFIYLYNNKGELTRKKFKTHTGEYEIEVIPIQDNPKGIIRQENEINSEGGITSKTITFTNKKSQNIIIIMMVQ